MLRYEGQRVYLACGATDMRRGINGLAAMVCEGFELDPFGSSIFAFCNRRRDRLKLLWWDGDGFWLCMKRLEKGRLRWPEPGEEATMSLSYEELSILLDGTRVELKLKREEALGRKVS